MTGIFIVVFPVNTTAAAMLFILAAVTDYLDGYIARKYGLVTSFGKIMDPIADKFLILSAFAIFAFMKMMWWWMFWAIALREVGVTLFRFWAMSKGAVLAAEKAGKRKTVIQMTTIGMLFITIVFYPYVFLGKVCPLSLPLNIQLLILFDIILLFFTVIVTVLSGITVFWNNRFLFFKDNRSS